MYSSLEIATFLFVKFQFNNGTSITGIQQFENNWTTLIMLFQFPLIAFFTWLIFYNKKYTFGEHLIGNAYIIGEVLLFKIALFPLYYLLNGSLLIALADGLYMLSILIYYTFAYYDWFYKRKGSEGLVLSIIFVFLLFIVIMFISIFVVYMLYLSYIKLGW